MRFDSSDPVIDPDEPDQGDPPESVAQAAEAFHRFARGGAVPPEPPGGRTNNVNVGLPTDVQAAALDMLAANGAIEPEKLAADAQALHDRIVDWWVRVSSADAQAAAAKSTEYGGAGAAIDLVWLGQQLVEMGQATAEGTSDWTAREVPTQHATELGIFFYLLGKIARWKAAILEGRPVSDDTIKDIHTYAMMARYNREHGSWP